MDLTSITCLKIIGDMDGKDIAMIHQLPNLETLDVSEARIKGEYEYPSKSKIVYDEDVFVIPCNTKIKNISIWPIKPSSITNNIRKFKIIGENCTVKLDKLQCYRISIEGQADVKHLYAESDLKDFNFAPSLIHIIPTTGWHKPVFREGDGDYYQLRVRPLGDKWLREYYYRRQLNTLAVFIPNKEYEKTECLTNIEPVFLVYDDTKEVRLVHYYDKPTLNIKLSEFENAVGQINEIEPLAFYGHYETESIDLAVKGLSYLGSYAFVGTSLKSITIPNNITQISPLAFEGSSIEEVRMECEYPPVIEDKYRTERAQKSYNIKYIVPQGALEKYKIGNWKHRYIVENVEKISGEFIVEEAGTLKKYITDENAHGFVSLVIKGVMDERDFITLNKCKNLEKLDLSGCYPVASDSLIEKRRAESAEEWAVISAFVNYSAEETKHRYEYGDGSLGEALYANELKNVVNGINSMKEEEEKNGTGRERKKDCWMPNSLGGLKLKEFIYPVDMEYATINMPNTIEKVVFPPKTRSLGGLYGCTKLKHIDVPNSVEVISEIQGCHFDVLDLSETKITRFNNSQYGGSSNGLFKDCKINILKTPKGLTYASNSGINEGEGEINEVYFYSSEAPDFWYNNFNKRDKVKIHIPKGTKAGWSSECIDDIILDK